MTALVSSGSKNHHVRRFYHDDDWEISWVVDFKHGRIRYPTRYTRITNREGARRFCKKWGLAIPEGLRDA